MPLIDAPVMVAPAQVASVDLVGRWEGALSFGGTSITLTIRVEAMDDGVQAFMDVPAQNARGLAVIDLSTAGGVVRFTVPVARGTFEGRLSADGGVWTGAWTQAGASLPLILTRAPAGADSVRPVRPQTPRPPYPYIAEDVTFANAAAGIPLAGTLTLPSGGGPVPAVVLLTGSGAQDRDETLFDHKPFAVWADALSRRGIAVLRYDDRGVGGSGGGGPNETTFDFATDAAAALAYLTARPEIDRGRIGLLGHSEGGAIAALAVQNGAPAAFVVMIAGPAIPGAALVTEQATRLAQAAGATPDQVEQTRAVQSQVMAAVVAHKDDPAAAASAVEAALIGIGQTPAQARAASRQVVSPWFRWFAAHDPAPALAALNVPLLAIYGEKDLQVPAEQNAAALRRIQPSSEIVILSNLNHLMQTAGAGLPAEYGTIEETISPAAIRVVIDWVAGVAGVR